MDLTEEKLLVLPKEKLEEYLVSYLSYLIDAPKKLQKMVRRARKIVNRNIEDYGLPTQLILHRTLESVLDECLFNRKMLASLDNGLYRVKRANPNTLFHTDQVLGNNRGIDLLYFLSHNLSEQHFTSLLDMFGSPEALTDLFNRTNLSTDSIFSSGRIIESINTLIQLPEESRIIYADYLAFLNGNRRNGTRYNPIKELNQATTPILNTIINGILQDGNRSLKPELRKRGFNGIIVTEGISGIIKKSAPDKYRCISIPNKWKNEDSIYLVLGLIRKALHRIDGFQMAEQSGDRTGMVKSLNDFLDGRPRLHEFFDQAGLGGAMTNFIKTDELPGFRKERSPKAVFEFYDTVLQYKLFDRTQETYVPSWKIQENGMWQNGVESVQLGLEATSDFFYYSMPGYRKAEETHNRYKQLCLIDSLLGIGHLKVLLRQYGLGSMIYSLIDPEGILGLKVAGSPRYLFEFYSSGKRLDWFNERMRPRIKVIGKNMMRVVYD